MKKDLTIYFSQKLRNRLPLSSNSSKKYKYFNDPKSIKSEIPQLIISDDNYQDLLEQSNLAEDKFFIYLNNNQLPLMESNLKNQNALIMSQT